MKHEQDNSGSDHALSESERTLRVLCHELSGLIDGASRYVEMAIHDCENDGDHQQATRYLSTASAALGEAGRMLRSVRLGRDEAQAPISRLASLRPVGEAVDHAADLARTLAIARSIRVVSNVDDAFRGLGPAPVFPVIHNALRNAMEMTPRNGTIEIRAGVETVGDERRAVIVVLDDGPGPTGDTARRAFELGYTTRRGGMGVGLALARSIIDDLGGEIELKSRASFDGRRGGVLRAWWPVSEQQQIGGPRGDAGGRAA